VRRVLSCTAWVSLAAPLLPCVAAEFAVIAQSGAASPDGNGSLLTFTSPALNDAGVVSFLSTLVGTVNGSDDNIALFRGSTSGLAVIARRSDAIGDSDAAMDFINSLPSINSAGVVSHSVAVATPPQEYVAFLGSGGPLTLLPRLGSASPTGENQLNSRSIPVLNNAGVAAYRANYVGMNPEAGIYSRAADGTITTRLLSGVPLPPPRESGTLSSLDSSFPVLNEAGQIALTANVTVGIFTRRSALRLDGTTVVELARDGDLALDGTTTIGNILSNAVLLNELGEVAFAATYTQPGVSSRQGIFRADDGGASLLTQNPLPESANLATSMRVHGLASGGQVAFSTDLGTGADPVSGIYAADDGGVNLIALEDALTSPESNKFFRSFDVRSISMNASGQVAFLADLSDTADGPFAGRGLYFYDPTDGLHEILRSGDTFEESTITSLALTGTNHTITQPLNQMQSPDLDFSGLNNAGQVAFLYALATGAGGVAVWSSNPVEPLPGDYNGNGIVDAADYTVWRDHLGQMFSLTNEDPAAATPGEVDQEDYDFWTAQFGATSGGGSGAIGSANALQAVPEPGGACLVAAAAMFAIASTGGGRRGRRR
jgi:hypothetical protein